MNFLYSKWKYMYNAQILLYELLKQLKHFNLIFKLLLIYSNYF